MDPIKERPKSVTTLKQEPFRQNLTDLPSKEKCREKKERKKKNKKPTAAANNLTRIV